MKQGYRVLDDVSRFFECSDQWNQRKMSRTSTTVGMVQRISSLSQSLTPSREKDGARYNVGCTYLESCTVDDSMLNGPPRLPEKSGDGLQDNA